MDIIGLGYLGLESARATEWAEYGPQVLGLGLAPSEDEGTVLLRMDERHHRIAVRTGTRERLSYLGWHLRNRISFEAAVKTLEDNGFQVTVADQALNDERGVHGMAWIIAPDQQRHEFFYGQMFNPHSFLPGRPHAGFMAGDGGLGHVVLAVPEWTDEMERFATQVLQFKWYGSGMSTGRLRFYSPKLNNRSHSIGWATMPGLLGLQHIGIEVKELDDVGIAYDLVQERGIQLMATLGRHAQDPVISFYSFTPSGVPVEYIWDGLEDSPSKPFTEQRPQKLSVWGHKFQNAPQPSTLYPADEAHQPATAS